MSAPQPACAAEALRRAREACRDAAARACASEHCRLVLACAANELSDLLDEIAEASNDETLERMHAQDQQRELFS